MLTYSKVKIAHMWKNWNYEKETKKYLCRYRGHKDVHFYIDWMSKKCYLLKKVCWYDNYVSMCSGTHLEPCTRQLQLKITEITAGKLHFVCRAEITLSWKKSMTLQYPRINVPASTLTQIWPCCDLDLHTLTFKI